MTEFVEAILAQIIGNLSTALIILIIYFNFLLFESYLRLIVWAILFSQALRQAKNNVISVLQYLSDDAEVDRRGFLTCVFVKSCEIFLYHPRGGRRTAKELFLNYGIFVFSMVGAVSIWMRAYSWVSFLHASIGVWIVVLTLIKILDRRVFYYRYFISDEVLVSMLLILGFFITGIFVMFYLGTESYMEGSRAASDLSNWVQTNFINDERTREVWSEQVANSRAMISAALSGVEENYNETMWWPPLKSLVKTYYLDPKVGDGNSTASEPLFSTLSLPSNMTLMEAIALAYAKVDSVNLTSVQLTDWTAKGLEVSSIAFGSVAQLVFLVFTLIIAFVSMGIRAFFFISSLFYLLCTNWDPIERFVEDLLPIQVDKRPHVAHSLRKVVEGVFFLPLKMSSLHALVTLVSFTIVNADFVYLATTFTFLISIVPIIPPYLVCLPWVISIWVTSSFVKAIALFAVQYFAFTMLDEMLYEKSIVALNSYVSALSVVFGVYVFGFEGVIFGPLTVCAVTFAYDVSNHGIQAAQDDNSRASEDLRAYDQDDLGMDDPMSTTDSTFGDEDDSKEEQLNAVTYDGDNTKSPNSSIFSNAMYRVISGPLVDRVRRRLSMDVTTDDCVCVSLIVEGLKNPRKVRFVVNKAWNQRALYDNLRRMLRVHTIEELTASDGSEIVSPLHIFPSEVLHVRVRPKTRPPLFPDSYSTAADTTVRVSLHALSPRYRRPPGAATPIGASMQRPSLEAFSPSGVGSPPHMVSTSSVLKGKKATPFAQALAAKQAKGKLRRQHSVPIQEHITGGLRRRGSYSVESTFSPSVSTVTVDTGAATFEDVVPLLSSRARTGHSSRGSSPAHRLDVAVTADTTPTLESPTQTPPLRPDFPATSVALDGTGSGCYDGRLGKGPTDTNTAVTTGRPPLVTRRSDESDTDPAKRNPVPLVQGCSSLLFSPLSVQDGSAYYPSDDDHDRSSFVSARDVDSNSVDTQAPETTTPTKTRCFDGVQDTLEHVSSPPVSKFKYVSKAKAQQLRQRKSDKGSSVQEFDRDLT